MDAGAHLLAVVEGNDEGSMAAFFAIYDESGEDDGNARKAGGYSWRHEPTRIRRSLEDTAKGCDEKNRLGGTRRRRVEKELPRRKPGRRRLHVGDIETVPKLGQHELSTEQRYYD